MVTKTKKRKSRGSKKRFIGKPTGQIQERVQAAGPEHFGIVAVDCAKRRSKWMLCNFYGKVIIEPTSVEHTAGGLRAMTQLVTEACKAEGLTDTIVAVEMTGIYHKPLYRAFRKAGFDTRDPPAVCARHPFASNHYRRPLHPDAKTDDNDLEAIFHAAAGTDRRLVGLRPGHVAGRRGLSVAPSGLASPAQLGQTTRPTDGADASAAASNDAGFRRSV